MKNNKIIQFKSEIIIPFKHGILQVPEESPFIKIIDTNILEDKKDAINWENIIHSEKVIIFVGNKIPLHIIVKQFLNYGKDNMTPISIAGSDIKHNQKMLTAILKNIEDFVTEKNIYCLDTIIIGDINVFYENGYFNTRALWKKRVVVTRANLQSTQLVRGLENLGAEVLEFPLLEIRMAEVYKALDLVLSRMESYQWIFFSMDVSVDYFIAYLLGSGYSLDVLKNHKICALTLETAQRLIEHGINIHYFPASFHLNNLKQELNKCGINEKDPILIIAGEGRKDIILKELEGLPVKIDFISMLRPEYIQLNRTNINKLLNFLPVDIWIFNGPLGIRECSDLWKKIHDDLQENIIVAMGTKTREKLEQEGLTVDIIPNEVNIPSLLEAIVNYYDNERINNKE